MEEHDMGWMEIVTDTNVIAKDISNYNQLIRLQEEGAPFKDMQPLLSALMDAIVRFKSAYDEIQGRKDLPLRIVTGALILLDMRLQESQITAEIFSGEEEQAFVSSTVQQISGQGTRLISQLSASEQEEVREMVLNARRLADYTFYVENHKGGIAIKQAVAVVEKLMWRNSITGILVLWGGFVLLLIVLAIFPVVMLGTDILGSGMKIQGIIGIVLLFLIGMVGFVVLTRYQKAKPYKEAMSVIEEFGDKIDLERFDKVDDETNGNRNRAVGYQYSAQTVVEKFFAGLPISALRTTAAGMPARPQEEKADVFSNASHDLPVSDYGSQSFIPADIPKVSLPAAKPAASQPLQPVRFCGECGAKIPDGAVFCANCGNRVRS
jgi:hypothetical protein